SSHDPLAQGSDPLDVSRQERTERVPVVSGEVLEHPLDNSFASVHHRASYFVPRMHRATPGTRTLPSCSNARTFAMAIARIRCRADSSTCCSAATASETCSLIMFQYCPADSVT